MGQPVEVCIVSHSNVAGQIISQTRRGAFVIVIVDYEAVVKCERVEIGAKSVVAKRVGTSGGLRISAVTHSEVLMTVVVSISFVGTSVDTGNILCSWRRVFINIKTGTYERLFNRSDQIRFHTYQPVRTIPL